MANNGDDIQVEKGNFTRIHNAILEHIIQAHFSSREYAAVLYLLRVTYGYQTTTAKLSGAEWEKGTGIKRQNIMSVVAGLVARNIILQDGGGRGRGNVATYKFNKYFDTWDHLRNESPSMHLIDEEMNPHQCIIDKENESPSMQENESPSMQCTSGLKKEKKAEAEAAAAFVSKSTISEFAKAYQDVLGKMIESPIRSEEIQEWAQRVPYLAWEYALRESLDKGHRHDWKYTKRILERLEREGYQPKVSTVPVTASATKLDFALEDISQ